MKWISVKDRLPDKNGEYLVAVSFFSYRKVDVVKFATNLHEVDELDFETENYPGWYELDSEVGYYETTGITHWAELPELPNE